MEVKRLHLYMRHQNVYLDDIYEINGSRTLVENIQSSQPTYLCHQSSKHKQLQSKLA